MWLSLLLACNDPVPTGDTATSPDTGTSPSDDVDTAASLDVGLDHRPAADACPDERPAEEPACGSPDDQCTVNADCTGGANGRCVLSVMMGDCSCAYDECVTDDDCSRGRVCACAGVGTWSGTNVCVHAECHVDADCATGLCFADRSHCGVTDDPEELFVIGYACATRDDTCRSDEVCTDPDEFCTYTREHTEDEPTWHCSKAYAADCE